MILKLLKCGQNILSRFYYKIKHDFKTLPLSSRFLNDLPNMNTHLNILVKNKNLFEYPPLCVSNGYTAQYEHTIFLDETKNIFFSQDDDYQIQYFCV